MRRIRLLFPIVIALLIIAGCSSNTQPSKKDEKIQTKDTAANENLKEDSGIWLYSAEMDDVDNYDGLDIKIDRVLISPSSAHIGIKGSMTNIGHSSFEAYPATAPITLNTGEELGPEEVITVSEEGSYIIKNKGDRLDFFYAWPMSNTSPSEVTSVSFSWRIFKTNGDDILDATTFTRKYTLNQ